MSVPFTPETLSRLQQLQQERKFSEEACYPGAPTEDIRVECERRVNHFLGRVISLLHGGASEDAFVAQATELERTFNHDDTDEREKVGDYIGEAMRIIGLEGPSERDIYFGFKTK